MDEAVAEPDKPPQGWFVDPFGIHEHRWFSQGRPTALVRDGRAEAQDPPPDRPIGGPLVPATPAARQTDRPSDDMLRAGDRLGEPTLDPQGQFDYFGNPALPGTIGVPPDAMDADGRIRSPWGTAGFGPRRRRRSERPGDPAGGLRRDDTTVVGAFPATPRRLLRLRWIALGGAVVWTSLVVLGFFMATTTVTTSPGHHRTETAYASNPVAALFFAVLLVAFDAVTGVDFVRRVRSESERWGVAGAVCAGLLGVLGVLSLATVGLSMLLLAFLLFAVARPIRPPRPVIGERVVPPPPKPR
jgi:hypothetical protein